MTCRCPAKPGKACWLTKDECRERGEWFAQRSDAPLYQFAGHRSLADYVQNREAEAANYDRIGRDHIAQAQRIRAEAAVLRASLREVEG